MNRDIIAIGGSAGGVRVLLDLIGELPADLPAAVFVVIHTSPDYLSVLPSLLGRKGPLKAVHPMHHESIAPGRIYVAPPDTQLIVRPGSMEVVRGPKENGHRPAVDALFRSASWAYGPRVVGLVLSGYQDCGTAGFMSIKARGGVTVAQAPDSADAPEMPQSAISRGVVDHVVQPAELAGLLVRLARETADPAPDREPARPIREIEGGKPGSPSELVCPVCHGVLTRTEAGSYEHYRCHVGHAFSMRGLVDQQNEEMERALWSAVRALEESATLSRRLSATGVDDALRGRFHEKSETLRRQADTIRNILLFGESAELPEPRSPEDLDMELQREEAGRAGRPEEEKKTRAERA